MSISRGDVILALFPDSNLITAKRRPALVVQADGLATGLPQTVAAMITSNQARASHASRWSVAKLSREGREMGLRTDSIVMTDNLATIRESEIDRVIGKCSDMSHVEAALRHTLGI
jgi:mRNA interferase MazF